MDALAGAALGSPEDAVVATAFDLIQEMQARAGALIPDWYSGLLTIESDVDLAGEFLSPPPAMAGATLGEGFAELLSAVDGLVDAGVLDRAALGGVARTRVAKVLAELRGADLAAADVQGERTSVRMPVKPIVVGSPVRIPVLPLSSGNLVAIGRHGEVVFFSPEGRVLAREQKLDVIEAAPVELGDGSVVVVNLRGTLHRFDSEGRKLWSYLGPQLGTSGQLLRLKDGGLFLIGEKGDAVFVGADGRIGRQLKTGLWVNQPPVQLADGSLLMVTMKGEVVRMDLLGAWKVQHEIGSGPSGSALQLRDGTVVVGDHHGTIHFLNADGTPKKKWRFFNVTYRASGASDHALIPLPDGRVVAAGWESFVVLNPDGSALFENNRGVSTDSAPILLEDGSFLIETELWDFTRYSGPDWRPRGTVEIGGHLTVPLTSMGQGMIAKSGTDGRLKVAALDFEAKQARVVFDWKAPAEIRSQAIRLADGRFAVGCDDGSVYLLDAAAADADSF